MHSDDASAFFARFRDLELKTWESGERYSWSVSNIGNGKEIVRGEAVDRESAMVAAAQAASADWGSVRWRGADEEDEAE